MDGVMQIDLFSGEASVLSSIVQTRIICGVDEAGRGPLAGAVFAAAVILAEPIAGLADSKKLSAKRREYLAEQIRAQAAAWAVASASVHIAEVFTTGLSGLSHLKLKNICHKLFLRLLLPGITGALLGAYLVTHIDGKQLRSVVDAH